MGGVQTDYLVHSRISVRDTEGSEVGWGGYKLTIWSTPGSLTSDTEECQRWGYKLVHSRVFTGDTGLAVGVCHSAMSQKKSRGKMYCSETKLNAIYILGR